MIRSSDVIIMFPLFPEFIKDLPVHRFETGIRLFKNVEILVIFGGARQIRLIRFTRFKRPVIRLLFILINPDPNPSQQGRAKGRGFLQIRSFNHLPCNISFILHPKAIPARAPTAMIFAFGLVSHFPSPQQCLGTDNPTLRSCPDHTAFIRRHT